MNFPNDIILYILDILNNQNSPNTIFNCLLINHHWNALIKRHSLKYLKTSNMFNYLLKFDQFKLKITDSIIEIITQFGFHHNLKKHKHKHKIKEIIRYTPNQKKNFMLISHQALPLIFIKIKEWITKYIYIKFNDTEYNFENVKILAETINLLKNKTEKQIKNDISIQVLLTKTINQIISITYSFKETKDIEKSPA